MGKFCFLLALVFASFGASAGAETWQSNRGPIEGRLVAVYGSTLVFTKRSIATTVSLEALPDAELARVVRFVAQQPANAVPWRSSKSEFAKEILPRLEILKDGRTAPFDPGTRPEPEFYVIYYGASFSPPCREFVVGYLDMYSRLQQAYPDRFETIFVTFDSERSDQLKHMNQTKMPWPVLRFGAKGGADLIQRWGDKRAIPSLAVVTRDGDLVLRNIRDDLYYDPFRTVEEFEALLHDSDQRRPEVKRAMFRLRLFQHIQAAGDRSVGPSPFFAALDPSRYQTVEPDDIQVSVDIDDKGAVISAVFDPKQSSIIEYQLNEDSAQWLFLPALQAGRPVGSTFKFPVKLR